MKPNEDGFYSVEDCVAVLSKPPKVPAVQSKSLLPMDGRKTSHKRMCAALSGTEWTFRGYEFVNSSGNYRIYTLPIVLTIIEGCEDFDALIDTLNAIKQLNK